MIHIKRPQGPPGIPMYTRKSRTLESTGAKMTPHAWETEEAIRFCSNPLNYKDGKKLTTESFDFKVYRNKPLRKRLEDLFRGKCAYCDSTFAHVASGDIEHFRPKAEIDTGSEKLYPGYYWLATNWHNLLLSCQYCNRTNYHETPDLPGEEVRMGKWDQFPVSNSNGRVRSHLQDIADEEPHRLLLNPCTDEPEEHLLFTQDGLVRARPLPAGGTSEKAEYSIAVYALRRKELVEEREKCANRLILVLEALGDAGYNYHSAGDEEGRKRNMSALRRNFGGLRSYLEPKAPYLALVRQIIRDYDQTGKFDQVKLLGFDPMQMLVSSLDAG